MEPETGNTTPVSSPLSAAHKGYAYQDLVAAYVLVERLVSGNGSVTIDRKKYQDDKFDDIEVITESNTHRLQIKSSSNQDRALSQSDFDGKASSLRIDLLVMTHLASKGNDSIENRLCTTWKEPDDLDTLKTFLVPARRKGTFREYSTRMYTLDPELVWPLGEDSEFKSINSHGNISRNDVVDFCKSFVIETDLPSASLDLDSPGLLEKQLLNLLTREVGIGRYPNAERRSEDVAALAVYIATISRTNGATITPNQLARQLALRTDFGRVSQEFPIDYATLQERKPLISELRKKSLESGVCLVLAGPGSGKSWALTQLAMELEKDHVVARHYCFLEPADDLVEKRVTTNVFLGNLLGEIRDSMIKAGCSIPQLFSAGVSELETFFNHAADQNRKITVIVDGLDHIARVKDVSGILRDNETDIIERLSTLSIPENVTLIIGSQPGAHLDPLRDAFQGKYSELEVPKWLEEEVIDLARSLGVTDSLEAAFIPEEEQDKILRQLTDKIEGSPLYASYLCRELMAGLRDGAIVNPIEWVDGKPPIHGDIARYYKHIYRSASSQAKAIADILGVIDFSVTSDDLEEIVGGLLSDWVPEAIHALSPILNSASSQGGLRVFHESFRRFMIQELHQSKRKISNVLGPVIDWLREKGFYRCSRSYRFLIPALLRAGREEEIINLVGHTFLRESLMSGHPQEAIDKNLSFAISCAASKQNWPALVRYSELSRAAESCFEYAGNDWERYWQTYGSIYGYSALAERLLFDGRPTLSRQQGIIACQLVDKNGYTAPWREYLSLPISNESGAYYGDFDADGPMSEDEVQGLAIILGRLRTGQKTLVLRRVYVRLGNPESELTSLFIRSLAKLLAGLTNPQMVATHALSKINRFAVKTDANPRVIYALLLGIADFFHEKGAPSIAKKYANSALSYASTSNESIGCVERGANADSAIRLADDPSSIDISLGSERSTVNPASVRNWVSSVRLHALSPSTSHFIDRELERINGEGWYRCWLRYVLKCSEVESQNTQKGKVDVLDAFSLITEDTRPFVGDPRACDLYQIHRVIEESLSRGLKLAGSAEELRAAVALIIKAKNETATRFDREDGGPISTGAFFSLVLDIASAGPPCQEILSELDSELLEAEASGTYYSTHAEHRLKAAQLFSHSGDTASAIVHLKEAVSFFLGYGFRKDRTIFEIIESVPGLSSISKGLALTSLQKLDPLIGAVLHHTDGRETRHAPNAWFNSLLETDATTAIEIICKSYIQEHGSASWIVERAYKDILRRLNDRSDPRLIDSLWEAKLIEIDYEGEGERIVKDRLVPIEAISKIDKSSIENRFRRLCASILNDTRRYGPESTNPIIAFAHNNKIQVPSPVQQYKPSQTLLKKSNQWDALGSNSGISEPPLDCWCYNFSVTLSLIRKAVKSHPEKLSRHGFATSMSYYISELVSQGENNRAAQLLYFLARETSMSYEAAEKPMQLIAKCLDNAEHFDLAAIAYALSFTSARGGGGWLTFADKDQSNNLSRAIEIGPSTAFQVIADECARMIHSGRYSGISMHLIEQLINWGDHAAAASAWNEAFNVISDRLPLQRAPNIFEPLGLAGDFEGWSIEESLAALLLVQVSSPEKYRRINALACFNRSIKSNHHHFKRALLWVLSRDITVFTAQNILQVLDESGSGLTSLIKYLEETLSGYVDGRSWSLSILSERILRRHGLSPIKSRPDSISQSSRQSKKYLRDIEFSDTARFIEKIEEIWPNISSETASRAECSFAAADFKYILRERFELSHGRRGDEMPVAEVIHWPTELVISSLDDVLLGLKGKLLDAGIWNPDSEEKILDCFLPDLKLHLSVENSRTPRPDWPGTKDLENKTSDITRLSEHDPCYPGWIRLSLYEEEYVRPENAGYSPPEKCIVNYTGMVQSNNARSIPPNAHPFRHKSQHGIWEANWPLATITEKYHPQISSIYMSQDYLGKVRTLIPPAPLIEAADLVPSSHYLPIRWYDRSGQVAIILRSWRVRDERCTDTEGCSIVGMDLLARPDMGQILDSIYDRSLLELQRIITHDLSE